MALQFVYPVFMWGLLLIIIPIIIHLFNFKRYKRVYFSDIRLIKEINEETQSQSRLKHILVLISRILIICSLVLAFAQPYIPAKEETLNVKENAISFYIDNSFSMNSEGENGSLIDYARKSLTEYILPNFSNTDKFHVLTNDFEERHQRFYTKNEIIDLINEIKISPTAKNISEVVKRQSEFLKSENSAIKKSYLLSDFQKSTFNSSEVIADSSIEYNIIPIVSEVKKNLFIDSCWFDSPYHKINEQEDVYVRIKNETDIEYKDNTIKLFVNDKQCGLANFNIKPYSKEKVKITFLNTEAGFHHGYFTISDYPITFDDSLFFSYNIHESINVLNIYEEEDNIYIKSIFELDSIFNYSSINNDKIDYSSFANQQLIIINELEQISSGLTNELYNFVSNGGSLLILPAEKIDLDSYSLLFKTLKTDYYKDIVEGDNKFKNIDYKNPFLKGVFESFEEDVSLPNLKKYYKVSTETKVLKQNIFSTQSNDALFNKYFLEKGNVYLSAIALNDDFSDFHNNSVLSVITLVSVGLHSQKTITPYYVIDNDNTFEINNAVKTIYIKSVNSNFEIKPEFKNIGNKTKVHLKDAIKNSGNYICKNENNIINYLSFNYDRKESILSTYKSDELKEISNNIFPNNVFYNTSSDSLSNIITENNTGYKLWKWLIISAILLFVIETLLIRIL